MYVPVRSGVAVLLGVLGALGPLSRESSAQVNPMALNPNIYANPLASRAAGAAVLGSNLAALAHPVAAARGFGVGYGSGAGLGYGAGLGRGMGYGSGMGYSAGMGRGMGYGSLMNSSGYGGGGVYGGLAGAMLGLGYGGIGSYYSGMNTAGIYAGLSGGYQGYLSGAASLTTAQANYYLTISQAKIYRQEARQASIRTRRAMIEEAQWKRAQMPDPEKIRQEQIRRTIDRARNSPPLVEVTSGQSLNALLGYLIEQQGRGVRGENVPLSEDTLQSIRLTTGDTRGNLGLLLKENGKLQWPQTLQSEPFKDARENFNHRIRNAFDAVRVGNKNPDPATLNDLDADLKKLRNALDENVGSMSPDQYTEASRYLRQVEHAVTALKSPNAVNYIDKWKLRAKNVAELVQFMRENGLSFAEATPGDEPAYIALYHALADYDYKVARLAGSGADTKP